MYNVSVFVCLRLVFLVGQPVEPEKEDALKAEAYMVQSFQN